MILSDLAKFLTTRSITCTRPLCNSWASCLFQRLFDILNWLDWIGYTAWRAWWSYKCNAWQTNGKSYNPSISALSSDLEQPLTPISRPRDILDAKYVSDDTRQYLGLQWINIYHFFQWWIKICIFKTVIVQGCLYGLRAWWRLASILWRSLLLNNDVQVVHTFVPL